VLPPLILILAVDIVVEQFPRAHRPRRQSPSACRRLVRPPAPGGVGVAIAVVALAAMVVVLIADGDHVVQALVIVAGWPWLGRLVPPSASMSRLPTPVPTTQSPAEVRPRGSTSPRKRAPAVSGLSS
jgi:hypothetical protein